MKKRIVIIIAVFILLACLAAVYLNKVVLPVKLKSLIVSALKESTQKQVSLGALQFNIFKGLVLHNISIYDNSGTIFKVKEASCAFLIPPIFKKNIIIPVVNLRSLEVFLRRLPDNSVNIQDLYFRGLETAPSRAQRTIEATQVLPQPEYPGLQAVDNGKGLFSSKSPKGKAGGFSFFVAKIKVTDSSVHFKDETFKQPFSVDLDNLSLLMRLSLAGSVKFSLKSEIKVSPIIKISAEGEYKIPSQELSATIHLKDFSPEGFLVYCRGLGVDTVKGQIDSRIGIKYKGQDIFLKVEAQSRELSLTKDKTSLKLNINTQSDIKYNLKDDKWQFSGSVLSLGSQANGIETIGTVKDIKGTAVFNNTGISSKDLKVDIWGFPVQADISLNDFSSPSLSIKAASGIDLAAAKNLLKDKFKFEIPADLSGEGKLVLEINSIIPLPAKPQIIGSLEIVHARLKLNESGLSFDNINGKLTIIPDQLKWQELNFEYNKHVCKTSGEVNNFKSPAWQIKLLSEGLLLDSDLTMEGKLIKFSKFNVGYLGSKFEITGEINPDDFTGKLDGKFGIELKDLKGLSEIFGLGLKQLELIKPQGLVSAEFSVAGTLNELKSLSVNAKFSCPNLSAYGLKAQDTALTYNQEQGVIDIPVFHLALYGGNIDFAWKMNLASQNLPFWITMDLQGVKLQELKLDTPVKDKDISGVIKATAKINGFSNDLSKISGNGNIAIGEGKLWQLNLFQGLGSVLLIKDFANVTFHEGTCDFTVKDKYIFTDDLKLKSDITNLSGALKIGFDNSIDAALDVQIIDEMAPITGTFQDVTTAIMGQAGKFGVIKISGTLSDPKFKFKPAVTDIFKGLKNVFFNN